jgi:hypothetical protein
MRKNGLTPERESSWASVRPAAQLGAIWDCRLDANARKPDHRLLELAALAIQSSENVERGLPQGRQSKRCGRTIVGDHIVDSQIISACQPSHE